MSPHKHDFAGVTCEYSLYKGAGMFLVRLYCQSGEHWVPLESYGPTDLFADSMLCEVISQFEAAARGIASAHGVQLQLLFD